MILFHPTVRLVYIKEHSMNHYLPDYFCKIRTIFHEHVLFTTQLGRWKYIHFKVTKRNSEDLKHLHHNIHLVKYLWLRLHGLLLDPSFNKALVLFASSYASSYPVLIVTIFTTADGFEYILAWANNSKYLLLCN